MLLFADFNEFAEGSFAVHIIGILVEVTAFPRALPPPLSSFPNKPSASSTKINFRTLAPWRTVPSVDDLPTSNSTAFLFLLSLALTSTNSYLYFLIK